MAKLEAVIKAQGGKNTRSTYTLPIAMVSVDSAADVRDREDPRYLEHFSKVKAGILQNNGIKDTVIGYRGKGDSDETIFLSNGRTRYYAAIELINEKALGADITAENFFIEVKIETGSDLDHLSTQFRQQNSLDFTVTERANLIKRMLSLSADNIEIVADRLLTTTKEVERYISFNALPEKAKTLVDSGVIGLANALELGAKHSDSELIAILESASEIKADKDSDTSKSKGKGYKAGKVTKSDLYAANLKSMGDSEAQKLIDNQRQMIIDAITLDGFDPYILASLSKKAETEIKRLTK